MSTLAPHSTRERNALLRPAEPRIVRALHFMDANLDRTLSIADLASEAGLSPSRFAHLFHAETGSTPARMFLRMRMMRAAELLIATRLPVNEVGLRVGFWHAAAFARAFRAWYGIAPGKYRRDGLALLTGIAEIVK